MKLTVDVTEVSLQWVCSSCGEEKTSSVIDLIITGVPLCCDDEEMKIQNEVRIEPRGELKQSRYDRFHSDDDEGV